MAHGPDGRFYAPGQALSEPARWQAVRLAHVLRCRDHLSYRKIVTVMSQYGVHRSLGQVFSDLHDFACPKCAGQPGPLPAALTEPITEPVAARVVPWGGRP